MPVSYTHLKHGRGLAVDINTLYNPYHKRLKHGKEVVEPATARPYLDRSKNHAYMIKKGLKEVLIVSIGSFFGGGMRYWISKLVQSCTVIAFPFGTMAALQRLAIGCIFLAMIY